MQTKPGQTVAVLHGPLAEGEIAGHEVEFNHQDSLSESMSDAPAIIVIDAFSSDSVPAHLLTTQALDLYLGKLAPDGVLAFHISNRYLKLEPLLGGLSRRAGLSVLRVTGEDVIDRRFDVTVIQA